jgi:uncharacterized protein YdeI (YjbR/CyaY-like superfamily)
MNPKVDQYIRKAQQWQEELELLRTIILDCGLTEELKWGAPCYSFYKKLVVIIGELKECCVLSFFKGVLLSDVHGILQKPGENTQTVRLIRFTNTRDIIKWEPVLKAYIYEAIEVEKAGFPLDLKKSTELKFPEEFHDKLKANPALKKAFQALTPGRQRAYSLYFSQPKQSKTRESRINKCMERILEGKGLQDDYMR